MCVSKVFCVCVCVCVCEYLDGLGIWLYFMSVIVYDTAQNTCVWCVY